MTGNADMLQNLQNYTGSDYALIGDGSCLNVCAIGDTIIRNKKISLTFKKYVVCS